MHCLTQEHHGERLHPDTSRRDTTITACRQTERLLARHEVTATEACCSPACCCSLLRTSSVLSASLALARKLAVVMLPCNKQLQLNKQLNKRLAQVKSAGELLHLQAEHGGSFENINLATL